MSGRKFAAAINCMDGRVQAPVIEWMKEKYGAEYIDMITEAGPVGLLSENKDAPIIESIKQRLEISIYKHGADLIAVVAHHDCAGNPVEKETQLKQIVASMKTVESWNYQTRIIGLWVDENWRVSEINFK